MEYEWVCSGCGQPASGPGPWRQELRGPSEPSVLGDQEVPDGGLWFTEDTAYAGNEHLKRT